MTKHHTTGLKLHTLRATAIIYALFAVWGCTPSKTVRGASIPSQASAPAARIPAVGKHKALHITQDNTQLLQSVQQLNKRANSPTFGLVGGFYQLPVAHPGGALFIEHDMVSKNFTQSQRLVALQEGQRPYAILSFDTKQAQSLEAGMQQLLNVGVQFVQMSTADALTVMRAEQQALQRQPQPNNQTSQPMVWATTLPPNVQFLISVQSGQGVSGPALVGRVIDTSQGKLLALRSRPDVGGNTLGNLVLQLVRDTLQRLAQQPATHQLPQHPAKNAPKSSKTSSQNAQQSFTCPCLQPSS